MKLATKDTNPYFRLPKLIDYILVLDIGQL